MNFIGPLFLVLLSAFILGFTSGCATLPNVSEKIDAAPTAREPRQIVSAKGLLSPKQSKAIMDRLQQSVAPTDMLERHIAVVDSVTESPLTKGNKVDSAHRWPCDLCRHVQSHPERQGSYQP